MRIVAIVLIVLGILALVYGGFSYTREAAAVELGGFELEVRERERVNVPLWAGVVAVGVGALLLVVDVGRSKR